MAVRAKVSCINKKTESIGDKNGTRLDFGAVYQGSQENLDFFAASPGLSLTLFCVNDVASEQFELGSEYYLDFVKAE